MLLWIAFGFSVSLLLVLARWNLWGAMIVGAVALGVLTVPLPELGRALASAWVSPSVLVLALAMTMIPLIGEALVASGRMEKLLGGLPSKRRAVYALAPAIMGMLPMPGGALLSSPLVERAGGSSPDARAAANIWFRHTLHAIYPLSPALITGALLAGLDVWGIIPYQLPGVFLLAVLGYFALLRRVSGQVDTAEPRSARNVAVPLGILLAAPAVDFALKRVAPLPVPEIATVAGVTLSLILALLGKVSAPSLVAIARKERPWRFGLIVIGVFTYLAVFQRSGLPTHIAALDLPPEVLCLGLGWILGFATGRQQAAVSLVIPLYTGSYGAMAPWAFAVTYFASYLGYLLSPLHPCLTVSAEYEGTSLGATWRRLALPSAIALAITGAVGWFVL
jgi:integral membrane protein (TIGR00529 family)